MNLAVTLNDAIDYAAAFASGGMNHLRRMIRQKAEPMSDYPNNIGLWKDGGRCFLGYGEYDGHRVHEAVVVKSKPGSSGPYARLYMRYDEGGSDRLVSVAIWENDGKLGNAKDLHGHFVNVWPNKEKKSPNGPDVTIKFVEKEQRDEPASREPAAAASSADDDPFGF